MEEFRLEWTLEIIWSKPLREACVSRNTRNQIRSLCRKQTKTFLDILAKYCFSYKKLLPLQEKHIFEVSRSVYILCHMRANNEGRISKILNTRNTKCEILENSCSAINIPQTLNDFQSGFKPCQVNWHYNWVGQDKDYWKRSLIIVHMGQMRPSHSWSVTCKVKCLTLSNCQGGKESNRDRKSCWVKQQ